ncbi:uncharacterized protein PpBr36_06484 [Pyricularia pennisetigena]|uniref:uncharacterized protein n=1 Tax=Pyricularia pennisetigena TaxID=1578925 RepID=UPI0011512984|nr:uncharacterized protein PpBr36_06484 [Pyricularia pennisetigena]TLS23250.1 hypothetical protein PpBr36_06484 [Pyricularia pennisetigena]
MLGSVGTNLEAWAASGVTVPVPARLRWTLGIAATFKWHVDAVNLPLIVSPRPTAR